jgi:DNA-binding NarL/FixJ family response regulator
MTEINFDSQHNSYSTVIETESNSLIKFQQYDSQNMDKIRVVVIEDHELSLIGIRTILKGDDNILIVGEATNGTDGLYLLNKLQPDIAIIDIGLPDKDGIQITQEIKQSHPEIKVIILTLRDSKETVLTAFAAGVNSYCMKDIGLEKLIEVIHLTYCGHTWIDPAIAHFLLEQVKKNLDRYNSHYSDNYLDEEMEDIYTLTERELEILQLIVDGNRNASIATKLYITLGTVKAHVRNILIKVGAEDRTQAAVHALRYGLLN